MIRALPGAASLGFCRASPMRILRNAKRGSHCSYWREHIRRWPSGADRVGHRVAKEGAEHGRWNHPARKSPDCRGGRPINTGKSTLFNRLTGLNQRCEQPWTQARPWIIRRHGLLEQCGPTLPSWICGCCNCMTHIRLKRKLPATTCFPADRCRARRGRPAASMERALETCISCPVVALNLPYSLLLCLPDDRRCGQRSGRAVVNAVALSSAHQRP